MSPLWDLKDLRGWHFVLTGGLLLHLSPYGFEEGMTGRYGMIKDSPSFCLEGIHRVKAVLAHTGFTLLRVFVLPERNSAILAHATARVLELPTQAWPSGGTEEPGLVVAKG